MDTGPVHSFSCAESSLRRTLRKNRREERQKRRERETKQTNSLETVIRGLWDDLRDQRQILLVNVRTEGTARVAGRRRKLLAAQKLWYSRPDGVFQESLANSHSDAHTLVSCLHPAAVADAWSKGRQSFKVSERSPLQRGQLYSPFFMLPCCHTLHTLEH